MHSSRRSLSSSCRVLLSLVILMASYNSYAHKHNAKHTAKSVIVVGAGIAGLNAAKILDAQGYEVTVLESRDRIGGRLWTDTSIADTALDLGASWIHGIESNPIHKLAQQHNVPLFEWDMDDTSLYDAKGNNSDALLFRISSLNTDFMTLSEQARFRHLSIDELIRRTRDEGKLSAYSEVEINYLVSGFIEDEYAAPSRSLSVAALHEGEVFGGPDVIFPSGYDQLAQILAQDLKILEAQTVTAINYESASAIVTANKKRFVADYVVVTVPLGVLKKGVIEFTPGLPQNKTKAIKALDMGTLNKVYLKFPHAFWQDEAQNIGYMSETKGQFTFWINLKEATGQAILLGFMSGDEAEAMENLADEEVVTRAMTVLHNIYSKDIPKPEQSIITRWASDPHSYGSYSYLTTSATSEMRADLAEPIEGKVFFAGEATHEDYPATVHGAFLSGQEAAHRIIRTSR